MKNTITCPCCGTTYDRTDETPEFERVAKSVALLRGDLWELLEHPEWSMERVRNHVNAILEERI